MFDHASGPITRRAILRQIAIVGGVMAASACSPPPAAGPTTPAAAPTTPAAAAKPTAAATAAPPPAATTVPTPAPAATAASQSGGNFTFWWWGQQEAPGLDTWLVETIDKYQQAHPGTQITNVLQATESLMPGFKAAGDAKQGPDLQYMWGGVSTMGYVWQGFVTPISDLLPKEELAHIFPSNLSETASNGKVWALPWYIFPLVMVYNRDMFKQAGLDPDAPPKTWDEFLAAGDKLKAAKFTPWGYGLKGLTGIGNFAAMFNLQELDNTIEILNPVVGTAKYTDPKYSGWFARLKELIDHGFFNKDVNSLEYFQSQELFPAGQAAMIISGPSQLPNYTKALGDNVVGVMLPPAFGKGKLAGKMSNTAQQLFVTSWSKNQKVAADFMTFMHTPERLQAMNVASGAIPPDDRFDASKLSQAQDRQIVEWAKTTSATNYQNYWPPQMDRENLFLAVQSLFAGEMTPDQAAQQVQDFLDRWRGANQDQVKQLADWAKSVG